MKQQPLVNNNYTKTARFWEIINGSPVKISLRPGQSLSHNTYSPTDEGWSSEAQTWEYDAVLGEVEFGCYSDGCDCDGRLSRESHFVSRLHELKLGHVPNYYSDCKLCEPAWDGVQLPKYTEVSSGQRDYAAEAMGY